VTRNTDVEAYGLYYWNENNLKTLTRNYWRASLVPAAAVIPAPRVYIKVVAVKKLVVDLRKRIHLIPNFVKGIWNNIKYFFFYSRNVKTLEIFL